MPEHRFVQVDVFTEVAFGGNQLAVFTDARGLSDLQMQSIAREMNYSESTFVLPPDDPTADARVRIFTPTLELPFAGHPTVGTGYILGTEWRRTNLALQLGAGTIPVDVHPGDGRTGRARMRQPLPSFRPAGASADTLAGVLRLDPADVSSDLPAELGSAGFELLFVPVATLDALRRMRPDEDLLRSAFAGDGEPAVYAFCLECESGDATAHARMFAVALGAGVAEDPATGSAAGPLGAYLVRHGAHAGGRIVVEQGHEMARPSLIEVDVEATGAEVTLVHVGGGVVRVAEGQLFV